MTDARKTRTESDTMGPIIVFSTKTKNVLTFRGQVNGDTITGTYGLHGRHAPFKAVRTSPKPTQ